MFHNQSKHSDVKHLLIQLQNSKCNIDEFDITVLIKYLESIVGGEEDVEKEQNRLIAELDSNFKNLQTEVDNVQNKLTDEVDVDIDQLLAVNDADARFFGVRGIE